MKKDSIRKDKLKSIDIRYFLIPFFLIVIVFVILVRDHMVHDVKEVEKGFEEEALNISEGYSRLLEYSGDVREVVSELLDEKLQVAGESLRVMDNEDIILHLEELSESLLLDEIHFYDRDGTIIHSSGGSYLGWKAYEGHPVHDFMISGKDLHIEEIRKDSESEKYYKYGYSRNSDGTFIQFGILADRASSFMEEFDLREVIEVVTLEEKVLHAVFHDEENQVLASSYTVEDREQEAKVMEGVSLGYDQAIERDLGDQRVYQINVRVYDEKASLGSLSLLFSREALKEKKSAIMVQGIVQLIFLLMVTGGILYYAYRRDRANIRIAYYDPVTGLPNEAYLTEHLEDFVSGSRPGKKAILLLNFRNLAIMSMTYGQKVTNRVLRQMSDLLTATLTDAEKVFRYGSEKLVIAVCDYTDREELEKLGERIRSVFEEPYAREIASQKIQLQMSVVELDGRNLEGEKLLQNAVLAMTNLPYDWKSPIIFYEEEMEKKAERMDRIALELRRVLENQDTTSFSLHYQPKVLLSSEKVMGFEALARLNMEEYGFVSPMEFIDIAEKNLLIYDLGIRILRMSCDFIRRLHEEGYEEITVSVNVSGIQLLRQEFVTDLLQIVESSGIDPSSLELEITESVLLTSYELINSKLRTIREKGIVISLDDFGTGYSSLSNLRDLHLDFVKIDREFIRRIRNENIPYLLTSDIISMCHKLGLSVVAEGVENNYQKRYLGIHGCDIVQGYLVSRPLPEDEVHAFLERWNEGR